MAHQQHSQFPQELIEDTVEHIHDDIKSLAYVSLVSRKWSIPTRRHLFQTVIVCGPDSDKDKGFEAFKDFLLTPQGISTFNQTLCLQGRIKRGGRMTWDHLDIQLLSYILSKLPNLENLKLKAIEWKSPPHRLGSDILPQLSSPIPLL